MGYKFVNDGIDELNFLLQFNDIGVFSLIGLRDLFFDYDKDEIICFCRVYEVEVGIMFFVLDIFVVILYVKSFFLFFESFRGQCLFYVINDEKIFQLKIIMCCVYVVEENGYSLKVM